MENLPPRSLLNDVFQILDSRIQYIEYQSSKLSRQSLLSNQTNPASFGTGTLTNPESLFSIEMTFKQIELHNRSLKLLLLLRSQLNVLNAPIIFELLTDSKYLDFDEEELAEQLRTEVTEDITGERSQQGNQ